MMVMMKGKDGDVGQNGSPVCCPRNLFILIFTLRSS